MKMTVSQYIALVSLLLLVVGGIGSLSFPQAEGDDADYKTVEKQAKKDLKSDDVETRLTAIFELAETNDARAVKLLRANVGREKNREVLDAYGMALGSFSDPKAVKEVDEYLTKSLLGAKDIYLAYHILVGFAVGESDEAHQAVMDALNNEDSIWLNIAALEAMGDSGQVSYMPIVTDYVLNQKQEAWNETAQIVPITAVHALARLGEINGDGDTVLESIETLLTVLESYSDDRIRYHTAKVMGRLAVLENTTDQVEWWRHWIEQTKQGLSVEKPEANARQGNTSTRPRFVEMDAAGKRIVFVLDISASMTEALSKTAIEKRKEQEKKGGRSKPIIWSRIKQFLDLAIHDLEVAIDSLSDEYSFNVVVYSTGSELLNPKIKGFVPATNANKKKFIGFVKRVTPENMTNIHAAMLDAFRVVDTKEGMVEGDPAVDETALYYGADTIFFLTDGWATWSDDSKEMAIDPRITMGPDKGKPVIGDGQFILATDILRDFERINKFRKVVVNTVGIGNHDKPLMRGFASSSGGTYVDLGD